MIKPAILLSYFILLIMLPWPVCSTGGADSEAELKTQKTMVCREMPVMESKDNEDCLFCHGRPGLGYPDYEAGGVINYSVDPEAFANSNHGDQDCTKCHNDSYGKYPHPLETKNDSLDCVACHSKKKSYRTVFEELVEEFKQSVHYQKVGDRITCFSCHNSHSFTLAEYHDSIQSVIEQDNNYCLNCHRNAKRFRQYTDSVIPPLDLIHAWLPNKELHWQKVRCVECHTPHNPDRLSHTILAADKAERRCVTCHSRDSLLLTQLYKHFRSEGSRSYGLLSVTLLNDSYILGSTRLPELDQISLLLLGITILTVLLHALVRYIIHRRNGESTSWIKGSQLHRFFLVPRWLRFWHWINAMLFVLLIVSGFSLHFADTGVVVPFEYAVLIHNTSGILITLSYLSILLLNGVSGNFRQYLPRPNLTWFRQMFRQARYYSYGIFVGAEYPHQVSPDHKFNPLQQVTYLTVVYLFLPLLIISGWIYLFPEYDVYKKLGLTTLMPIAIGHYVLAVLGAAFVIAHIYMITFGATLLSDLRTMLNGWHETKHSSQSDTKEEDK